MESTLSYLAAGWSVIKAIYISGFYLSLFFRSFIFLFRSCKYIFNAPLVRNYNKLDMGYNFFSGEFELGFVNSIKSYFSQMAGYLSVSTMSWFSVIELLQLVFKRKSILESKAKKIRSSLNGCILEMKEVLYIENEARDLLSKDRLHLDNKSKIINGEWLDESEDKEESIKIDLKTKTISISITYNPDDFELCRTNYSKYEYRFVDQSLQMKLIEKYINSSFGKDMVFVKNGVVLEAEIDKNFPPEKRKFMIGPNVLYLKECVSWSDTILDKYGQEGCNKIKYLILSRHPEIINESQYKKIITNDEEIFRSKLLTNVSAIRDHGVLVKETYDGFQFTDQVEKLELGLGLWEKLSLSPFQIENGNAILREIDSWCSAHPGDFASISKAKCAA